ncbi:MAG: BtrH N-terminal domain-containing protein [Desulfatibacillaceae bacterium]
MVRLPVGHNPGRHCASTGICNLVRHHGLGWTEAMCFGLGAGLGLYYFPAQGLGASRMVHVRHADYESVFFRNIGHPFAWRTFSDPQASEAALCDALDLGRPAILQTDIYYLPHFSSRTHFPGHLITAWGYDPGRQVFYVTDTERTEVIEVAFEDMRKARFCDGGIYLVEGNMYAPEAMEPPEDMSGAVLGAILGQSRDLLAGQGDIAGLPCLEKWRDELADWKRFPDWAWTARFAYQVLERRGTGGGGFRLMYADFLAEAAAILPGVAELGLYAAMSVCADAWRGLAAELKEASEREEPDFSDVGRALDEVIRKERAYHELALTLERI